MGGMAMVLRACLLAAVIGVSWSGHLMADDVEAILVKWADHVSKRPRSDVHGTAKVYSYDTTFRSETRHRVEFWLSGPDEWRIDGAPMDVRSRSSQRRGDDGKPFQLESIRFPWRWSRSSSTLTVVQDENETPTTRSW